MNILVIKLNESDIANANGTEFEIIDIIDVYNSVIWNDKYNEAGDFELVLPCIDKYLLNIKEDYLLISNESDTIMSIDAIEIIEGNEEKNLLLKGLSIESWLNRRIIYEEIYYNGEDSSLYPDPLNDPSMIVNAIQNLVNKCFFGIADSSNKRSTNTIHTNVEVEGSLVSGHPFLSMFVTAYIHNQNLYDVIVDICQQLDIGFKFKKTINGNRLYFSLCLYYGLVLTDNFVPDTPFYNPNLKIVVFSEQYDNLISSDYHIDKSTYKNVIKVDGTYHKNDPNNFGSLIDDPINIDVEGKIKKENNTYIIPYGILRREEYLDSNSISDKSDYKINITNETANLKVNANFVDPDLIYKDLFDSSLSYIGTFSLISTGTEVYWEFSRNDQPSLYTRISPFDYGFSMQGIEVNSSFSFSLTKSDSGSDIIISQQAFEERLKNEGNGILIEKEYLEEMTAEVFPDGNFTYGLEPSDDYYLGDVVTIRNRFGVASYCRITEYLRSEDESEKTYHPTFTIVGTNIGTEN